MNDRLNFHWGREKKHNEWSLDWIEYTSVKDERSLCLDAKDDFITPATAV